MEFKEESYEEEFQKQRFETFRVGAEGLFQMNKKGFINGFNLKYLSMPVSHSMIYNYWTYQVLKLHMREQRQNKIIQDFSLIAYKNDLSIFQMVGLSGYLVDQNSS